MMRVEWQSGVNFGSSVLFQAKDQIGRQYDSVDRIIAFRYVAETVCIRYVRIFL